MRSPAMALVACVALGAGVASARASPCGDEIARLEQMIGQSGNNPAAVPTAPQSIDAQLSHQPTPQSVERARAQSRARFAAMLARAKAFEAEGKTAKCLQATAAARLELQ